jgi:hypothetical protein
MKLNFTQQIEIACPIQEVIKLFADREHLAKWQPGLISSEQIETSPQPKYKLLFQFGRRKMNMTETITRNNLPKHFDGVYEMKVVRNTVMNSFEKIDDMNTRWTNKTTFHFKGLMNLVAPFMKDNFRQQSWIIMKNFKGFCEYTVIQQRRAM